jgi:hypothetical protein
MNLKRVENSNLKRKKMQIFNKNNKTIKYLNYFFLKYNYIIDLNKA